jgi:hypothetical protein
MFLQVFIPPRAIRDICGKCINDIRVYDKLMKNVTRNKQEEHCFFTGTGILNTG